MENKKTVVITRSKWLRGAGSCDTALFRSHDGMMCCLGFVGCRLGYTQEQMKDMSSPCDVDSWQDNPLNRHFHKMGMVEEDKTTPLSHSGRTLFSNTKGTMEMINANDEPEVEQSAREEKLAKLTLENFNIILIFED